MSALVVIDSGGANLASLEHCLARLGVETQISRDPAVIRAYLGVEDEEEVEKVIEAAEHMVETGVSEGQMPSPPDGARTGERT